MALAPYWLLQLATPAKSFRDNPLIGSVTLNALGLYRARVRLGEHMATWRRRRLAKPISHEDRVAFDRDGFVVKRGLLPPARFASLQNQLLSYCAEARETVQGRSRTRRMAVDAAMLRRVPELRELLRSPAWSALVRYVASFGGEPLYYLQTIFAQSDSGEQDPQTDLHTDTFHATMKAWFFLTDVADDDGPFCYVPGSHRRSAAQLAWEDSRARACSHLDYLSGRGSLRIGADELAALGLPQPVRFAVPANTLIVADTSGFHARGVTTRPAVRLEIWAYSRRNPFLPWTGLNPLSWPGLAERRAGWMWRWQDRLERLIGQPWRPVGRVTPLTPPRQPS